MRLTTAIGTLPFALAVLLATACGGSSEPPPETAAPVEQAPPAEAGDPGGGTAGQGAPCDFGGAESRTCQGGLTCCYPATGEPENGTCQPECEG